MIELRDYQSEVIAKTGEVIASGKRRPIIVMPTGGGKTIVAADIIRSAVPSTRTCWCSRIVGRSSARPAISCTVLASRTGSFRPDSRRDRSSGSRLPASPPYGPARSGRRPWRDRRSICW